MTRSLICLMFAAALTACSHADLGRLPLPIPGMRSVQVTPEQLQKSVTESAQHFRIGVASTADAIAQQSTDRAVRRRALLWKIRMTPLIQTAALAPGPVEGMLELLTLATTQRQYLTEGSGRALFADQQPLAVEQAAEIEERITARIDALLEEPQARQLERQVEDLARRYPIRGEFLVESAEGALAEVGSSGSFDWVVRLPLAPLRALEGVESGALAIREFNTTAQQFTALLADLPQQARLQTELLLYDVEDRQSLIDALHSMGSLADSAHSLSLVAEQLPVKTREQIALLLRDSDASQVELRRTIAALQQTLGTANQAVANARPLIEALERTAGHVERAGATWGQLVRDVAGDRAREPSAPGPTEPPADRPFDVTEYERTAASIGSAAREVRGMLAELPQRSDDLRAWIDFALWRLAALIALLWTLRIASRLILTQVMRSSPAD